MRGLRVILRKFLILLLMLVAIGLAAIGIASYWRNIEVILPAIGNEGGGTELVIRFDDDVLSLRMLHSPIRPTPYEPTVNSFPLFNRRRVMPGVFWRSETITLGRLGNRERVQNHLRQLWLPAWLVPVLLLVYPLIAFIRGPLRRHRRRKRGLCLTCGYNLTGNTSGVCPECGRELSRS